MYLFIYFIFLDLFGLFIAHICHGMIDKGSEISGRNSKDELGFHNDLTDIFDSEIIVKADFVPR